MNRAFRASVAIAAAIHAALLLAVGLLRAPSAPQRGVTASPSADEVSIALEDPSAPAPAPALPSPAPASGASDLVARIDARHATNGGAAKHDPVLLHPQPSGEPGASPAPSDSTGNGVGTDGGANGKGVASGPKLPPLLDLSSPGKHAFILPPESSAPPATKEEQVAAKLDAQVKAGLDAHEQIVSGGYGGPVVGAAHSAALGFNAPQLGWATIDVETDAKGAVTTVKVVEFGGDPGWQRVAKDIHGELAGRPLKVPTGANGVHVRVRISADMKYPSGATQKVQLEGLGARFDVADIGQPKRRVVAVHIVEEHRL